MVFPYMDHDLAGLLENPNVKLSMSQIKLYTLQLCEGIGYLHRVSPILINSRSVFLGCAASRTKFCIAI